MPSYRGVGNDASHDTSWITTSWLQNWKTLGLNTFTIQYFWDQCERQDGSYNMTTISWLDHVVQVCEQAGMKLYLAHRSTWGITPWYSGGWMTSWNGVFDPNSSIYKRIIAFIEYIVARYDSSPAVLGFNIENFPYHNVNPLTQTQIDQYHLYGLPGQFNAARAHSSKPILVAPIHKGLHYGVPDLDTHYWFDKLPPPIDANSFYTLDAWGIVTQDAQGNWIQPWPDWGTPPHDKEHLRIGFDGAIQYGKNNNVKIFADESGIPKPGSETDIGQVYLRDLYDVIGEFTDSWIYHFDAGPHTLAFLDEYAEKPGYSFPPTQQRVLSVTSDPVGISFKLTKV